MAAKTSSQKIAAVLIRGQIGALSEVKSSLAAMRLLRRHACVILEDNAVNRGMLDRCKDYIAYGPIDDAMVQEITTKRQSLLNRKGEPINVFRLHPPRGGYKASTKLSYQEGGVLGLRREQMGELLKRML